VALSVTEQRDGSEAPDTEGEEGRDRRSVSTVTMAFLISSVSLDRGKL
jgi:hypothetical protein